VPIPGQFVSLTTAASQSILKALLMPAFSYCTLHAYISASHHVAVSVWAVSQWYGIELLQHNNEMHLKPHDFIVPVYAGSLVGLVLRLERSQVCGPETKYSNTQEHRNDRA